MEAAGQDIRVGLLAPAYYVRLGLRSVLAEIPGVRVVFDAAALAEVEGRPVVDVLLHAATGELSLAEFLRAAGENTPIILLLDTPPNARLLERLRARPWAILSLEAGPQELAAAIHATHAGLLSADPALSASLLALPAAPAVDEDSEALTPREREVLQLLARGLANKQIAAQLGLSENTVKFHISSVYAKLGAGNRAEAVTLGARRGWISL